MSHTKAKRLGAGLGTLVLCAGLASLALAQDPPGRAPAEQAALDRFCGEPSPCTIINGAADPDSPGSEAALVTPGAVLAQSGKPPSACPAADAAYREIGIKPDAFVGPCPKGPPGGSAERFRASRTAAIAALEGSR